MCEGCHGIARYRTAYPEVYSVPKLGGQSAAYLSNALHAYKAKQRSHPSMRGIAASLSDQDIADLAAYYSEGHK
jgi:cytochrome c553